MERFLPVLNNGNLFYSGPCAPLIYSPKTQIYFIHYAFPGAEHASPHGYPLLHYPHRSCHPALSCLVSCLLTLYTAVMSFEILFPFGLWVSEPGWLLNHSQLV